MDKPELLINGKRTDGRMPDELRPIKIWTQVVKNAVGSAMIEWGNNKVLAAVQGPKEALPKHISDPSKAIIKCRYSMAPFSSLEDHGRSGPNRRAIEISKVTREVFERAVMLDYFPGSEIDIYIEVLQSDGGTRAAGITAAAVALATSGIPMYEVPYSVSVGKAGDELLLDLNKLEDNYSDADMPLAISPRTGEIMLLQMDGDLTRDEISRGIEMAMKAGKVIVELQEKAIRMPYEKVMDKYKK